MASRKPPPTIRADFPVWSGTPLYSDPADPVGFRRRHLERTWTYIKFLQDNGLTTRQLIDTSVSLSNLDELKDFKLRWGDLTEEGQAFVRDAEQPWLEGQDRGHATTDDHILDRRLKELRKRFE